MRIAFLHPDLGLGGAERLVVDAAVELQGAGHEVVIFTAHHDRSRCFEETRDGTLEVRVHGDFLPMHVGQRLRAPCAMLRMLYLATVVALRGGRFDVIFCDLVAHVIPLLKLMQRAPVVFYCHFPDQLLAPRRAGLFRLYRAPIDWLEETGTGMADRVMVNSEFTAAVFRKTFPRLGGVEPVVVYPGVPLDGMDAVAGVHDIMVLCLSRFEPKKNIGLAVEALVRLREVPPAADFADVRLVIAGGYDARLAESRDTLAGLRALVARHGLEGQVSFHLSPTDAERKDLLQRATVVLFPVAGEHFGYVPVEAMAAGRPVIAAASGGPLETMLDGETGFLCAPEPRAFADALAKLLHDPELRQGLGARARRHVEANFSRSAFGRRLDSVLRDVVAKAR